MLVVIKGSSSPYKLTKYYLTLLVEASLTTVSTSKAIGANFPMHTILSRTSYKKLFLQLS